MWGKLSWDICGRVSSIFYQTQPCNIVKHKIRQCIYIGGNISQMSSAIYPLSFWGGRPKYQGLVFPRIGLEQKVARNDFYQNTYLLTLYKER